MSGDNFETRAAHCVEEIGQENWNAFSDGRPFASYAWYLFGERSMPNCRPYYVSVIKDRQTIARASFWLIREEPLPVSSKLLRAGLANFLHARPLLVCRSPLADSSGLILPPSPYRREAFERILSMAEAYSRTVKASFLVFDYLDPAQADLEEWRNRFVRVQLSEPGTFLPITWNSFDQYLQSLSKTAWKDYRRQFNQASRMNLVITTRRPIDLNIAEILPLIRNVEARHGAPPKPWAGAMLESAAGINSSWIEARVEGRLVGCGLLLADGDDWLATLLGLDYNFPYVYFQIMYSAIRKAIEEGARLLRAGSGAYEFKRRLGFCLETNNNLRFAGQTRFLSQLGRLASRLA